MSATIPLAPLDLGRLESVDAFELEPGVILWDRFCVVGNVTHAGDAWTVTVTDVQRQLGQAPHHRLGLHYVPGGLKVRERIRTAAIADSMVQPHLYALFSLGSGTAVICEPVEGVMVRGPLPRADAGNLALALAGLLTRLHGAGLHGLRLGTNHLRQCGERFALAGFGHLFGGGRADHDVRVVVELLRELAGEHLGDVLGHEPSTARELFDRVRLHHAIRVERSVAVLPPTASFVGRTDVMNTLLEAITAARIARSSVILVRGEQGVGKSRILQQLATLVAGRSDALFLAGTYASRLGTGQPGLARALEGLVAQSGNEDSHERDELVGRVRKRTGGFTGLLTRYSPELAPLMGEHAAPPAIEIAGDFVRHSAVIASAIRGIGTQQRPLVLALDDVESADAGSLAIVRRLATEEPAHHTVVVAAVRDEVPAALDTPEVSIIELPAFSLGEVESLIVDTLPGNLQDAQVAARLLHGTTQGVALAVWTSLQRWVDSGTLARTEQSGRWLLEHGAEAAPVADLFRVRLSQLDADQRWIALLAAVRGGDATVEWLATLTGYNAKRVSRDVGGVVSAGVLIESRPGTYRFAHDAVRDLLIDDASDAERQRAHHCIATWLEDRSDRVRASHRAFHAEHASGGSARADLGALHLDAGREMLGIFDLDRASWHFGHALKRCEDRASRLVARGGIADAAVLAGRVQEAADAYEQTILAAPDRVQSARIASKAIHALYSKSAEDEAYAVATRTLALVDRPLRTSTLGRIASLLWAFVGLVLPMRGSVELRNALCVLYPRVIAVLLARDPISVLACVLRALRVARGLWSKDASMTLAFYAALRGTLGHYHTARAIFADAEDMNRSPASDWNLGVINHVRAHTVELPSGDYTAGQSRLDRARRHFANTGDFSIAALSSFFKAAYGKNRERASVLLRWLDDAEALAQRHGSNLALPAIRAVRLLVRARQGHGDIAADAARIAAAVEQAGQVSTDCVLAHTYLALALLRAGDHERARAQIRLAQRYMAEIPGGIEICEDLHHATAAVLLQLPQLEAREARLLRKALRRLRRVSKISPRLGAASELAQCRLARRDGNEERARLHARRVIERLPEHGQQYITLEAHLELAELGADSDEPGVESHFARAGAAATALGVELPTMRGRGQRNERPASVELPTSSLARHSLPSRRETTDLGRVLEALRPALQTAVDSVPIPHVASDPELQVDGRRSEIESLVLHLALTARDAMPTVNQLRVTARSASLDQAGAAKLPGGRAGEYAVLRVETAGAGPVSRILGGISACRRLTARLDGFLDVEEAISGVTLAAYLPVAPGPARASDLGAVRSLAIVRHPDARVRRTVAAALSQLGIECRLLPVTVNLPADAADVSFVFAAADELTAVRAAYPDAEVVALAARGEPATEGFPNLWVPFVLGDLERLVETRLTDSSDTEARPE